MIDIKSLFLRAAVDPAALWSQKARDNALKAALGKNDVGAIQLALSAGADGLAVLQEIAQQKSPRSEMEHLIAALEQRETVDCFKIAMCNDIVGAVSPRLGHDLEGQKWLLEQPWGRGPATIQDFCHDFSWRKILHPFIVNDDLEGFQEIPPEKEKAYVWHYAKDVVLSLYPLGRVGKWCIEEMIKQDRQAEVYQDAAESGRVDMMRFLDEGGVHPTRADQARALRAACGESQAGVIDYLVVQKHAANDNPDVSLPEVISHCKNRDTRNFLLERLCKAGALPVHGLPAAATPTEPSPA